MTVKVGEKITIPRKAFNGDWWAVPAEVAVECPRCTRETRVRPAVIRYRETQDFGDQHKRFDPAWPAHGWEVQWVCGACGSFWYKGHANNYATTEDIKRWIADFRAWYRSLRWE